MIPTVRLLGSVQIRLGEDAWEPPSHLTTALLAYLAHQGDWVDRAALSALFWPESDPARALTNLRSLLARTKREPFAHGIEIETTRVRWRTACDAIDFQRAIDAEAWDEAIQRYEGLFLDRMSFDASPEFDTWLAWAREHHRDGYRTASFQLATDLRERGDVAGAIAVLRDLVRAEPLDEEAVRLLMRLHAAAGRPDAANRAFHAFARQLERELDLEPSSDTAELFRAIERGEAPTGGFQSSSVRSEQAKVADDGPGGSSREGSPPGHARERGATTGRVLDGSIPPSLTRFFGREKEIAAIVELLTHDDGRLVTITGAGGVGKTRLAAVAAERLREAYEDGVAFVSLESVTVRSDLAGAIAQALGLDLRTREDAAVQLVRGIGRRRLLLVLDNLEHLLPVPGWFTELLHACAGLDVLVTSRERMGLPYERLIDLRGLPFPTEPPPSQDDAERYAALACLVARMRQVRPDLPIDAQTIASATEICRWVRGLPLALELAAVWVRSMPLDRIADEIRRNLDFLSFGPAAASDRHRSVRAAFEHSWKLLTSRERDAMRKLAVFRGGFRRSAAAFVADASIAVLAALVDKSLLRVSLDGRYDCHPLIAAFALEKLQGDPDEERAARRRHAETLVRLREHVEPSLDADRMASWRQRLDAERENLGAALAFAHQEQDGTLGTQLVVLLRWLYWPWSFIVSRRELIRDLLALPARVEPDVRAAALHVSGVIAHTEGDIQQAIEAYRDVIDLTTPHRNIELLIRSHANLANIERDRGHIDEARAIIERGLELLPRSSDSAAAANLLNAYATMERLVGRMDEARSAHERALEIGRRLDDPQTICQTLNGLAYVARDLGHGEDAARLFEQTLGIARRHRVDSSLIASLEALGSVARREGDLEAAFGHVARALEVVGTTRTYRLLDRVLDTAGDLLAASGRSRDAARLWGAGQAIRRERGASESTETSADRSALQAMVQRELGLSSFEVVFPGGPRVDADDAIALARHALAMTTPSSDAGSPPEA